MIKVVNRRFHKTTEYDAYVARPNVLGNPYTHLNSSKFNLIKVSSREEAVSKYKEWFDANFNNRPIRNELNKLLSFYKKNGKLNLVCWCKQDIKDIACHGDIIKSKIEDMMKE